MKRVVVFLFAVLIGQMAFAIDNPVFIVGPQALESNWSSIYSRGQGGVCLARSNRSFDFGCSSTQLSGQKRLLVGGAVSFTNGFDALEQANDFLSGVVRESTLREIFGGNNQTRVATALELGVQFESFQVRFSPFRAQLITEMHNPNLPEVGAVAAREMAAELSTGQHLSSTLSWGLSLELKRREFVNASFRMDEVVVSGVGQVIDPQVQYVAFLRPEIAFAPRVLPWEVQFRLQAKNIGLKSRAADVYEDRVDLDFGVSNLFKVPLGTLSLGLEWRDWIHAPDVVSRLRLGSRYTVGGFSVLGGGNADVFSLGTAFFFKPVEAGIVYETRRTIIFDGDRESLISTELGVRI